MSREKNENVDRRRSDLDRAIAAGVATSVAFMAIAFYADLRFLATAAPRIDARTFLPAFLALLQWTACVGAGLTILTIAPAVILDRFRTRGVIGRLLHAVGVSAPWSAIFAVAGLDLLAGGGISEMPWIKTARLIGTGAAIVVPAAVVFIFARSTVGDRSLAHRILARRTLLVGFVAGLVLVSAIYADRRFYPQLYPSAHLLLWVSTFLAAALFVAALRVSVIGRMPLVVARVLAGVIILIGGSAYLLHPLDESMAARRLVYRNTWFLKRAMTLLAPKLPESAVSVDPAIASALRAATELDGAMLDKLLPNRRRLNVLLVSLDALRPDHLSSRGNARPTSPNIDRFLERATDFRNAWTCYPKTLPAFSVVFRGRYLSGTDFYHESHAQRRLPSALKQKTMAEVFTSYGYRTEAVIGFRAALQRILKGELHFQFQNRRASEAWTKRQLRADEVLELATAALDEEPEKPFFLWVHFFDPHPPHTSIPEVTFGNEPNDHYDAKIAFTDRAFGGLISALRTRDLEKNTVVVLFSDHGTELGERGLYDHGFALNQTQIHVPYAIYVPGVAPQRIETPVDLASIMPTMVELTAAPAPHRFDGRSLLPYILRGDPTDASRTGFPPPTAFAELDCPPTMSAARGFAARRGNLKVIWDYSDNIWSLYDLAVDPKEENDLSASHPEVFAEMRALLEAQRALTTSDAPDPARSGR